jgi:hypothetical protein
MNKKTITILAVLALVAMVACGIVGLVIFANYLNNAPAPALLPTLAVAQQPTQPARIPPTTVPQQSVSLPQILSSMGFQQFSTGWKYDSGTIFVLVTTSDTGFGIASAMGTGYDAGGEGDIAGKLLANMVNANLIPYSVASWLVNGAIANAQSNPRFTDSGFTAGTSVYISSNGTAWLEIVVSYPTITGQSG